MRLTKNLYFYPEKGMMDSNTYVIKDDTNIIIDPGLTQFLPELLQDLRRDGIDPKDIDIITNTHLHGDHCWANEAFQKTSGAKIRLHPLQKKFWEASVTQTSRLFGVPPVEFTPDDFFDDDKLKTGELEFELIPSPGHSPDSVCFYCPVQKFLICGDVIFSQNTGRVDLPGGSARELRTSIERLSRLEIEYLLPGHMEIVAGREKVKANFDFVKQYILSSL
jgi:glyoxylase-like metal-dependent hydrolase (beta-lactamase superfamily II)